jgi:hypothetical protein
MPVQPGQFDHADYDTVEGPLEAAVSVFVSDPHVVGSGAETDTETERGCSGAAR